MSVEEEFMKASKNALNFVIAVVLLLATTLSASAQITTGTVAGTVKDPAGGMIPGATVILVSEAQGTRSSPVVTSSTGDFVFPNIAAGKYGIEVSMTGFKSLKQSGIIVGAGDRVAIGTLTIEVGGVEQTIEVRGDSPLVQTQSGERSFTIATDAVANLPIANRSFIQLASLAPGVAGTGNNPARLGGGGANNVMMDGVSTMDTGSNAVLLQMTVESIAEVKVLTSAYQAEYGRSSGLQITAITKGGTNRFRGSVYNVERDSKWNANSQVNILNGDAKAVVNERDFGYSLGGPIGKPGGNNKLFFFYSHEYAPRTAGGDTQRFRVPTELERRGDFSKTTDNNGGAWPYIRDSQLAGTCSATSQAACFADGGVLGRIPANRLYETGLNILKLYPMPNVDDPLAAYNYEKVRPIEKALGWQPAVRVDYQPWSTLRATLKYSGWAMRNQTFLGTIPGFNDTRQQNPRVTTVAGTVNYTLSSTLFLEGTYGHSQNELAGCALAQQGTGPTFCRNALPMNGAVANRNTAGLGGLPMIFPDALDLDPRYYAYRVLDQVQPPIWENGQILKTPNFTWAGRVANSPPNIPFPGFLNINATDDVSISLTKVAGQHTIKTGFYNTHSYKAQQQGNPFGTLTFTNDANNPLDAQFPFANAALGIFSQYQQQSRYIEGSYVYNNTEAYIQDNWRVNSRLTLDYGVRLVHQQPQYDELLQASNFFVDEWSRADAPLLYIAGCSNGAVTCSGSTRQAKHPVTGQLLGPNSTSAIGTLVAGTGDRTNGLLLSGQGIADTTYTWPMLAFAPRFGVAYDVTGTQKVILRGGAGLFYDRPSGNSIFGQITNPPSVRNVTLRNGQLQALSNVQFSTEGAPALDVFEYDGGLPSSTQWNAELQMTLPWASSVSIGYVGQHSFNTLQAVNINSVDLGAAFLPENQDPTLGINPTPGAAAVQQDQMRTYRGYGNIDMQLGRAWRTFHSIQLSFNRRFRDGISFGFNDTITLYDHQSAAARIEHGSDGSFSLRDDQAKADQLLGTTINQVHVLKGNFVWDLPDLRSDRNWMRGLGWVINDWRISGVWTAATGTPYTIGFQYQNGGGSINLTGSPNYNARIRVVGDPGSGCSSDVYRQFNTAAFEGPQTNSDGLESGNGYVRGCFTSVLDLAIAREIPLKGGRSIQLRVDMFNAPNSAIITGRQSTMNLTNPADPVTATNLPFNPDGTLKPALSLPRGAGFGVATTYQDPRTIQIQVRFSF
jgi:carboxypeptidase family protein